jgi:hypothetical protein
VTTTAPAAKKVRTRPREKTHRSAGKALRRLHTAKLRAKASRSRATGAEPGLASAPSTVTASTRSGLDAGGAARGLLCIK